MSSSASPTAPTRTRLCELALEAITSVERVLKTPEPVCNFKAFGDSSLDFTLSFLDQRPEDGTTNVSSCVLLALWDTFKREGIEIPFPQRDINMRTPVKIVMQRDGGAPEQ